MRNKRSMQINAGISALCIMMIIVPYSLLAQGLHIRNSNLILNGAINLVLQNANFTNDGNFMAGNGSTVIFSGNGLQTIGGSQPISFQNVTISKTNGTNVQLNTTISVAGALSLTSGDLNVNSQTLTLGDNATIVGEGPSSSITGLDNGKISVVKNITTPANKLNPGNIGIEITTKVAPGLTIFERTHKQERLVNGKLSIKRGYNIMPARNLGLNATIKFFYSDAELAGNDERQLLIWQLNPTMNVWTQIGKDGNSTTANWVSKSSLSQLGKFTLGNKFSSNVVLSGTTLYPNPSINIFTVELTSDKDGEAVLGLYDQSGRLLQQKKAFLHAGVNKIMWNLGNFAPGLYHVVVDKSSLPIIKVK